MLFPTQSCPHYHANDSWLHVAYLYWYGIPQEFPALYIHIYSRPYCIVYAHAENACGTPHQLHVFHKYAAQMFSALHTHTYTYTICTVYGMCMYVYIIMLRRPVRHTCGTRKCSHSDLVICIGRLVQCSKRLVYGFFPQIFSFPHTKKFTIWTH